MVKGGCPAQASGFQVNFEISAKVKQHYFLILKDTLSSFLGWVTGMMEGAAAKVELRKDEECKKKKAVMYFDVKS